MGLNNWDIYEMIEGRDFQDLKKRLKKRFDTFPVKVVQWGFRPSGTPFVVIQGDRPIDAASEE